jgi:hypothetical protein
MKKIKELSNRIDNRVDNRVHTYNRPTLVNPPRFPINPTLYNKLR